jgi:hypothetical protein
MRARRILIALSSLAVVAAGLTMAPTASANSVQVQSYQRASQSEACTAQLGETPWQAAWGTDSSWHPTWERWANGGTGGWTCTRSITWAKTIGCAKVDNTWPPDGLWLDFGSGYFMSPGAMLFADASCTQEIGPTDDSIVWADGFAQADSRCKSLLGPDTSADQPDYATQNTFSCVTLR